MALLRLMLVSLAACGQAGAQPSATSGLTPNPVLWSFMSWASQDRLP